MEPTSVGLDDQLTHALLHQLLAQLSHLQRSVEAAASQVGSLASAVSKHRR